MIRRSGRKRLCAPAPLRAGDFCAFGRAALGLVRTHKGLPRGGGKTVEHFLKIMVDFAPSFVVLLLSACMGALR